MGLEASAKCWLQGMIDRFHKSKTKKAAEDSYEEVATYCEEHGFAVKPLRSSATKKNIIDAGVALAREFLQQPHGKFTCWRVKVFII